MREWAPWGKSAVGGEMTLMASQQTLLGLELKAMLNEEAVVGVKYQKKRAGATAGSRSA